VVKGGLCSLFGFRGLCRLTATGGCAPLILAWGRAARPPLDARARHRFKHAQF